MMMSVSGGSSADNLSVTKQSLFQKDGLHLDWQYICMSWLKVVQNELFYVTLICSD